jgi:3-dehydroquinate synthase
MVDSSIGGKTGVDFKSYKNMVGAFYMPVLVYVNVSVLKTLPKDEYYAGYGEIIKHGLIADRKMVDFLDTSFVKLSAMDTETMLEMIYNNVNIKRKVVEEDPKEDGLRAILNFGHTCGHAIEKQSGLKMLHGQCVAVGCVCACYISYKRGLITKEDLSFIEKLFQKYNLPVRIKGFDAEQVVETTSKDKKKDGGCIRFILIQNIGNAIIDKTVTKQEMLEAVNYVTE